MITADYETMMRQAPMTAREYLLRAVRDIDEILGVGYAKAHPELIGTFLLTCAIDFGCGVIAKSLNELREVDITVEDT